MAAVEQFGERGLAALEQHVVVAVFGDLLRLAVHDAEGHEVHGAADGVVHRQLREADAAVLADVVEQDGGNYGVIPDADADGVAGHEQRVDDVGVAALAKLPAVLVTCEGHGLERLLHPRAGGEAAKIGVHLVGIEGSDSHSLALLFKNHGAAMWRLYRHAAHFSSRSRIFSHRRPTAEKVTKLISQRHSSKSGKLVAYWQMYRKMTGQIPQMSTINLVDNSGYARENSFSNLR